LFGPLGDDLFVLHWNDGLVMFEGVADHEKAGESVELRAQVTDAAVQSYSWDLSQAPNATNVTETSSYRWCARRRRERASLEKCSAGPRPARRTGLLP
jgi:hypothetical protein